MQLDTKNPQRGCRRRFATIAMAAMFGVASSTPMAAIVDSGPVNLAVPMTSAGLYLNLVTGASGSAAAVPGWDFNAFGSANLGFFPSISSFNACAVVVASANIAAALAPGTTIGPASTFQSSGTAQTTGTAFRTTGTEYVGISFNNEATGITYYGYVQIQTTAATGFPATIRRYVYENTGAPITIVNAAPTIIFGYGAISNHLVSFDANAPGTLLTDVPLTGLAAGEFLLGIDFRPATGQLYAIASKGVPGAVGGDRVVTINTTTGAVTSVIPSNTLTTPVGAFFGLDFSPVPDRLREVGDGDANMRLNPNNGTLAGTDTSLAYATGDPNQGADPSVVDVAYTNNMPGAAMATLFGIDTNLDVLARIGSVGGTPVSPNTGQLFTIGPLGVGASSLGGFDIHYGANVAYAALHVGGVSGLYTINLASGAATLVGTIGSGATINGLSVAFANVPTLVSAHSRRVHGAAGTFDLPLSLVATNPTTEPRQGPAQTIVFTFANAVTGATVTVPEGAGVTVGAPTFNGNEVIVDLGTVTDGQYVTIALINVADVTGAVGGGGSVRVGFLLGDVNQNRVVAVSDLGLVNAQLAQLVTAANYLKDVNATGTLTVADKGITNANLTHSLPPP